MKIQNFLSLAAPVIFSMTLLNSPSIAAQSQYDAQFIEYPTYSGDDLELLVDNSGTHFRLWSPKAQDARVNLYDNGHTGTPFQTLPMKFDASNGTWTASLPEKLYGKFYTFQIK